MSFSESNFNTVRIQLPNGAIAKFEVTNTGREDVNFGTKQFQPISDAIEGILQMISLPIQKVKPKKTTVKFGMELGMESGNLTAVILKGSGKANLEITMEWENTV